MVRMPLFICHIFLSVIQLFSDIDSHCIHRTTSTALLILSATGCALKTEPGMHTFLMAKLLSTGLEGSWLQTIWRGQGNQLETVVGLWVVVAMANAAGVAADLKADIGIAGAVIIHRLVEYAG